MWTGFNPVKYCQSTKTSHRKRGFKVQIKTRDLMTMLEDVFYHGCPYCGKEVKPPNGAAHDPEAFSLDIKNPGIRELTPENAQIICQECNIKKGNLSHKRYVKEFQEFEA